jgi:ubiquinone/menaquinone biosynthesis C-methylase UbiE
MEKQNSDIPLRPIEKIAERWDKSATIWEFHLFSDFKALAQIAKAIEPKLSSVQDNDLVLDLAAGADNQIYYPDGFDMKRVVAIDASPKMLASNPSGTKILADVRRPLSFDRETFQAVICVQGLRYFENQEAVIAESLRVAKPEAWLVFIDYQEAGDEDFARPFIPDKLVEFAKPLSSNIEMETLLKGGTEVSDLRLLAVQKS